MILLPHTRSPKLAALLALVALLATQGVAAEPVRLGANDPVMRALLSIGVERGYFERADVEATLVDIPVGEDPLELLADGELDLAALGAEALLDAEGIGVPLRGALLLGYALEGDSVIASPAIRDVSALRGNRIGVAPGSSPALLLDFVLQRSGLSADDVEIVPLDAADTATAAIDAFRAGKIDAAALRSASLERVLGTLADPDPDAPRPIASAAERPGLIADVLAGDERWLNRNKESVKGVIGAWSRTVSWVRRNPGPAAQALATRLDIDDATAAEVLDGRQLLDVGANVELLRGEYQKVFSDMSEVIERRTGLDGRGVPSANRYLSLAALRQVAAGR